MLILELEQCLAFIGAGSVFLLVLYVWSRYEVRRRD